MGMEERFEEQNLENLLSPFSYVAETPHARTSPEVPGSIYLSGVISQDCTWGCSFNQSVIKCFPIEQHFDERSGWAGNASSSVAVSSSSYSFGRSRIHCAVEVAIHNQRTSTGARKLLLGLTVPREEGKKERRGALVLFDPIRCVPMKWIELPEPVKTVAVLSHFEEGGSNRPFFNETMMAMVGIAAVGMQGGGVVLVDLGLDDPSLMSGDYRKSKFTYRLLYVAPHEYAIATKRHNVVSSRKLIALKFTNDPEEEYLSDGFHYCRPNRELIQYFDKDSVGVSCIEYVPATGSLIVGYTFGAFQIVTVNNMEIKFSSELHSYERYIPIYGFCFQQPVDDPKNFCYIWVMYGEKTTECTNMTFMELHSLLYEHKSHIEHFGHTYDDLKVCNKRLMFPLIDDFLAVEGDEESGIRNSTRPIRIWSNPDSDLMFCVWEVGRGGFYYLGIFDLNQWYSNHTKECIVYHPITGLCPYWVSLPIELADVVPIVMDVRIIPKSIVRWENPHFKQDLHLYPASLSFRAVCLTNSGVSAFEHFGVQEKLIRKVLHDGCNLMIEPANIKSLFVRYGLEPICNSYGPGLPLKDRDRYFVLSVLFECRRSSAITRLATAWLDGSYANVGCTIDLIIDWIGSYMQAVRNGADRHWDNLLNFPDDSLPPETLRFINFSNFAWTSLHRMLITLMNPNEVYSTRELQLEDLKFGLSRLVQYSAALLMLFKAKLLPESDPGFLKSLTDYYEGRREDAAKALQTSQYIDEEYKKSRPLMIDHLMDCLVVDEDVYNEWHVEEGTPLYPPQHIGYLANMFLWPDADPKAVARVFLYFLIDLNAVFAEYASDGSNGESERKIRGNFKAVIDAAGDEYEDIYKFWLLDHGFHDEILVRLKEKDRLFENDGLPWCAAAAALTAAGYESDVAELLLKSCPTTLAKLLFNLMTFSPVRYNSLVELMLSSNVGVDGDLLRQFFEISDNRNCLAEFIQKKAKELPPLVREALLEFLLGSDCLKRQSLLLMYYVHVEDYAKLKVEFARVRENLRHKKLGEQEERAWRFQENYVSHLLGTTSKKSIVENFLRLQAPKSIKQMQCTINLAIAPAADEGRTTPPPSVFKSGLHLPPQLRRIKLNETIASDPLSPLRRYAGRIQTAMNADSEEEKEKREWLNSRRKSVINSRASMSYARRKSVGQGQGLGRQSINRSVNLNTSVEGDERNTSVMRSEIDLVSILKPPSVDHRLEKSRGMSLLANASTGSGILPGMDESVAGQLPVAVHSIMKEADSSKRKSTTRKVELRFENMSLSSEDDKDDTIYEDAENIFEESVNEGEKDRVVNDSFVSAADKSLFPSDPSDPDDEEEEKKSEQVVETIKTVHLEVIDEEEEKEDEDGEVMKEVEMEKTKTPEQEQRRRSSRSRTPRTEVGEEKGNEDEQLMRKEVEMEKPKTPEQEQRRRSSRSRTPRKEGGEEKGNEDGEVIRKEVEREKTKTPEQEQRRSSRSRTPKTDVGDEKGNEEGQALERAVVDEVEAEMKEEQQEKTQRKRRSSRSRTPTREVKGKSMEREMAEVVEKTEEEATQRKKRRVSRSRTPTREVAISEEVVEGEVEEKRDQLMETIPEVDQEREMAEVDVMEKTEVVEKQRKKRGRTPAIEVTKSEEVAEGETAEVKKKRRKKAPSSRATTPTRELHPPATSSADPSPDPNSPSGKSDISVGGKSLRRSTRRGNSVNRELLEIIEGDDEQNLQLAIKRSLRSTRSRTPTRDSVAHEVETEQMKKVRATMSTTPTRELALDETLVGNEGEGLRTRATRRSSKTPTREVPDVSEAESDLSLDTSQKTRARKGKKRTEPESEVSMPLFESIIEEEQREDRPSAGPSPDPQSPSGKSDISVGGKPVRRSARRANSINRELLEIIEGDDEANLQVAIKRSLRSTRSRTPTRDSAIEEEPEKGQRMKLRATRSTTPTRELALDETLVGGEGESEGRRTRVTRSRTPSRTTEVEEKEASPIKRSGRGSRASKTPTREVDVSEAESELSLNSSQTRARRGKKRQSTEPESEEMSMPLFESMSEEQETEPQPSTSKKAPVKKPKEKKRFLKYFEHHQDLSTVLEDSLTQDPSIMNATVPKEPTPESKPKRRIKGIKQKPTLREVEESSTSISPEAKPTKRRKQTFVLEELDEIEDDAQSESSVKSKRSTKAGSTRGKGKAKRGKGK